MSKRPVLTVLAWCVSALLVGACAVAEAPGGPVATGGAEPQALPAAASSPTDLAAAPAAAQSDGAPGAAGSVTTAATAPSAATPGAGTAKSAAPAGPAAGKSKSASPVARAADPAAAAAPRTGQPGPARGPGTPAPAAGQVASGPDNSDVGVVKDSIKIGAILPLSGPIGPYGKPVLEAILTPLRAANDAGGVNGRRLDLIFCDDAFSGERGLACAKKLVDQDKVFIVLADGSGPGAAGALPYLVDKGVPVGGTAAVIAQQYREPTVFPMVAYGTSQARIMAEFSAKTAGAKTAGIITLANVELMTDAVQAYKKEAASQGLNIVAEAKVNLEDPDCTSQMLQMQSKRPDTIYLPTDAASAVKCFAAANSIGYKPPKQFSSLTYTYIDVVADYGGAAADGHYTMALTHTPETTNNAFMTEYLQRTKAYYPSHRPWTLTPMFYAAGQLNVDVFRGLGRNVTRKGFLDGMNSLTNAVPGLGIDVTFRPGPKTNFKQAMVVQQQGQQFVPVTGFLTDDSKEL